MNVHVVYVLDIHVISAEINLNYLIMFKHSRYSLHNSLHCVYMYMYTYMFMYIAHHANLQQAVVRPQTDVTRRAVDVIIIASIISIIIIIIVSATGRT